MKIARFRLIKPIIWGIEFIIIVSLVGSIITIYKKKDVVGERNAALVRVESENARLKSRLSEVERPEFVEKEARDKLGLVKPGEVVVLVGKHATASPDVLRSSTELPRWQQWWQLFF